MNRLVREEWRGEGKTAVSRVSGLLETQQDLRCQNPSTPHSSDRKGLLLVNKKVESPSQYPGGMNIEGNVSATCRECVIFVFLPEELTNYMKMPTSFRIQF